MAHTETRPGFRLPWTAERAVAGSPAVGTQTIALETETPQMIDAMAPSSDVSAAFPPAPSAAPLVDTVGGGAMTAEPRTPARRPSKLMADLSRAMQAAAEQARDETLSRFDADAKSVVEEINATSTVEAAALRRQADDDVAAVREWSKVEMARLREQTEERIGLRKSALEGEMDAHASVVQARIEGVGARVATYRTEMDAFFGRLLAEEDPTRIATMAETMPEPPSLAEIAASIAAPQPAPFPPMPLSSAAGAAPGAQGGALPSGSPAQPGVIDFAAAEAEAAAFSIDANGSAAPAPMHADNKKATPATTAPAGRTTTRVSVHGLVSVASIASFKREFSRTVGVSGISVSSGPDGEFVFTVTHETGLDVAAAVTKLPGFAARITAQTDETLEVAAQDPDSGD